MITDMILPPPVTLQRLTSSGGSVAGGGATRTISAGTIGSSSPISSRRRRLVRVRWAFYVVLVLVLFAFASIPIFIFYDAAMEELHYTDFSSDPTKKLLFVGWTSSLTDLAQNWIVNKEMEEICRVYDPTRPRSYGYRETHEGGVRVHIFYQHGDDASMHEIQAVLVQQGCSPSFTKEEPTSMMMIMEEETTLRTRSYERELLLQDNIRYDAIVNMDLDDVISLPSLSSLQHALEHAIANPASIICANERRTWHILFRQARRRRSHRKHLLSASMSAREQPSTRPQSRSNTEYCSQGFTMYGWDAWSSPVCNFDRGATILSNNTNNSNNFKRQKDHGAHIHFQECLKVQNTRTWIGVQPDLIIWRQSKFPWLLVLGVLAGLALSFGHTRSKKRSRAALRYPTATTYTRTCSSPIRAAEPQQQQPPHDDKDGRTTSKDW